MILADSSIWVDHFRRSDTLLRSLIAGGRMVMHPYVAAELALGPLSQRHEKLALLDILLTVNVAETAEVRRLMEAHSLYSRGIGFVDAHLIASCLLTPGTKLWTWDGRLADAAKSAGVQVFQPRTEN